MGMVGDAHVVQHGQVREQSDVLEGPADAQLGDLERFQSGDCLAVEQDTCRLVGTYRPVIMLKTVVLPAPLGPIRPCNSPG